uniref:Uncharacterized protein n=1 Tax=Romanomermis culicivorax TaxID=13658 RepID=A0A915KLE1_ROMCU
MDNAPRNFKRKKCAININIRGIGIIIKIVVRETLHCSGNWEFEALVGEKGWSGNGDTTQK